MSASRSKQQGDAAACPGAMETPAPARLGPLQRLSCDVVHAAAAIGLTAQEAANAAGVDRNVIAPRISELRRKGLVVPSGRRRRNPSGKMATVWIAAAFAEPEQTELT